MAVTTHARVSRDSALDTRYSGDSISRQGVGDRVSPSDQSLSHTPVLQGRHTPSAAKRDSAEDVASRAGKTEKDSLGVSQETDSSLGQEVQAPTPLSSYAGFEGADRITPLSVVKPVLVVPVAIGGVVVGIAAGLIAALLKGIAAFFEGLIENRADGSPPLLASSISLLGEIFSGVSASGFAVMATASGNPTSPGTMYKLINSPSSGALAEPKPKAKDPASIIKERELQQLDADPDRNQMIGTSPNKPTEKGLGGTEGITIL